MSNNLSRRIFFQQLVLAGAGLQILPLLQACDSKPKLAIPEGTGMEPFKTWQEILYALQHSPDNFIAKRDRLVQEKDPKAMFNFVRDELILLPTDDRYFRDIWGGFQYGVNGALRTGMATPREKAIILRDMLIEAGFESRIVTENLILSEEEVKNILFRESKVEFNPPVSDSQYKKWRKSLGVKEEQGDFKEISDISEKAQKLASMLLEKTTPEQRQEKNPNRFQFGYKYVPAVGLIQEGKDICLHLFDPTVPFGQMHPKNRYQEFLDTKDVDEPDYDVTVSLKATDSFNLRKENELLTATYKASELVGNQLKINFLNNLTFEEQATQTIGSINTFTPSIALQDINKDATYLEERSFLGEPFSLSGEKVFEEAELFSKLNFKNFKPGTIDDVVSLEISAKPKVFPQVEVEIRPLDTNGEVVEGLSANNFKIKDNGNAVRGILKRNLIAPKILVLHDTSLSMPSIYRGKGMDEFVENTEVTIKELYPHAKINTLAVGSNVYTSALKAAQTNNDLILYVTDAHNSDKFDSRYKAVYEAGPPIIFLNVYESDTHFKHLRENLNFTEIPASDTEITSQEISRILGEMKLAPYAFQYNAFEEEGLHDVEVSIEKTPHTSKTNYQFPEVVESAVGKRIVGLYLYVKVGRQYEQRRILAGYDKITQYYVKPTVSMARDVHEALMGGITVAIEQAGATTSIRFSEYLQTLMDTRSWMEPYLKNDTETALEEIKKGAFDYPSVLLSMMQPIEQPVTTTSATYVSGLRFGVLRFIPAIFSEKSKISFDYMRTSEYRTLTRTGNKWFETNASKTAQLALLEASVFPTTTYSELEGLELAFTKNLPKGVYNADKLGENQQYFKQYLFKGGMYNFFDAEAKKKAFWNMNYKTGELYGILPELTGGGGASVEQQLKRIDDVVKEYQRLLGTMNMGMMAAGGGLALGIVSAYSLTLVKLYAFASQALVIMDTSGMDDKIKKALAELACNVYKEILYTSLGPVGMGMAGIENLIASMGGSYSFVDCPA